MLVVVATLVVVALVVAASLTALVRRPLPDYSGAADLAGLSGDVRVLRDGNGIAQVYADTPEDLFAAQGYVHAQDRFFEMDYRRHVTAGRLSELVGEDSTALAADSVIRTMGWRRVAEQEVALLDESTVTYLEAYSRGVNAYLRDRSPSELALAYTVLGVQVDLRTIEPWTPVDSLAWLKAVAWDLRSNYDSEMGRALAFGAVGDESRVAELYPPYPIDERAPVVATSEAGSAAALGPAARLDGAAAARGGTDAGTDAGTDDVTDVDDPDATTALDAATRALDAVPVLLGRGDGIGSNAWAVGPELSATGGALLANDPHLAAQTPSTWYQVGLHCTDVGTACPFDVGGFGFSGLPGVLIGHNADVAWGMSNLRADVTDFFLEQVGGDTYLRDGAQEPLDARTEVIRVAGADDVEIEVRSTVHGPLLSDVLAVVDALGRESPVPTGSPIQGTGYEVALSWTALTPGRTADAIFAMDTATGWEEFRAAASLLEVPAQNLVYADTTGRIGYQASGRIPVRGAGTGRGQVDGTWPRLGWSSAWDWTGTIPFEDLPSVLDPADGFVVAANQAVVGPGYPHRLSRDWDYGYRSERIRDVLEAARDAGEPLGVSDMAVLQTDVASPLADFFVPALLSQRVTPSATLTSEGAEFTRDAVEMLRDWDGTQPPDSAAAAYANAVWARTLDLTFGDELSSSTLRPDGGSRWFEVVSRLLAEPESTWWDDRTTPTVVETRDQILTRALVDARLELTASLGKVPTRWEWGKLHRLQLRADVLGADRVPAPVRGLYNPDPLELGGGTSLVDALAWDASRAGDYDVTSVPSMRMVVDLGDLDASTWVDLTGVSGHPASAHYGDQTAAWAEGTQLPWPFTAEAVEAAADDELLLRPAPRTPTG